MPAIHRKASTYPRRRIALVIHTECLESITVFSVWCYSLSYAYAVSVSLHFAPLCCGRTFVVASHSFPLHSGMLLHHCVRHRIRVCFISKFTAVVPISAHQHCGYPRYVCTPSATDMPPDIWHRQRASASSAAWAVAARIYVRVRCVSARLCQQPLGLWQCVSVSSVTCA